ncbi:MAG: hypothetical protein GY703_02890 [Gammaproteobacteria bacterium]|nr:hypothetical protein [Gammaproteobacteria bacterium]
MRLSENFTLEELLASQVAERSGGDMLQEQTNPNRNIIKNLTYLTHQTLQPLRTLLRTSITVSSSYRCPALNTAIGGSAKSQHMEGKAADIGISSELLHRPSRLHVRTVIEEKVRMETGQGIRQEVNASYYLFATACFYLEELNVDQLIHEYGKDGSPAWVHISSSPDQRNRRQILIKRKGEGYTELGLSQALLLGCR